MNCNMLQQNKKFTPDLEGVTSDLETRLTTAEENIQGETWYRNKMWMKQMLN